MHLLSRRSVTAIASFALLGCSDASSSAQAVERTIQEVGGSAPLRLTQLVRVGSAQGEGDAFGRVMDVALDGTGRILVADDLNHRVTVFGADGRLVGHVGREGHGPGEFSAPWVVRADAGDSLWVWDVAESRISVFSPDLRYRRGFRTPPQWVVTSMEFLPDGTLVVAAVGSGEEGPLHLLDRVGTRLRTFGPPIRPDPRLEGFEASLLGGAVDIRDGTIAFTNKSPYELRFFDGAGRPAGRCTGRAEWTTPPTAVVVSRAGGQGLAWNRYVHSTRVLSLDGGRFLNVLRNPRTNRTTVDLLTRDCRLLRRTTFDGPLTLTDIRGDRVAAVRTVEFPEVLVYRLEGTR